MSGVVDFTDERISLSGSEKIPTGLTSMSEIIFVMGIPITNTTCESAIDSIAKAIAVGSSRPALIAFANAHTLNLAFKDQNYRRALQQFDAVFGDGTGVRWAARMRGESMLDNVNGTDLVPSLLSKRFPRRNSYFMLGADPGTIEKAAAIARSKFVNWDQSGYHHGFVLSSSETDRIIHEINTASPDVLLVGMGNPIQELWLLRNRYRLNAKVCIGVGGLFDFWSGNVSRAPHWLRSLGHEWLWRLWQQPLKKASRYLVGNPLYLYRAWMHVQKDQNLSAVAEAMPAVTLGIHRKDERHELDAPHSQSTQSEASSFRG